MQDIAIETVFNYIYDHLDKTDARPEIEVYVVWFCKILQNWKCLLSSTLLDGMYYEVAYNGDADELYLDAYKKFENHKINDVMRTRQMLADVDPF